MDYKEIDQTVIVTQKVRSGGSDLYATLPWVARLNPKSERPICNGWSYGRNKHCKAKATLAYFTLDNKVRYVCGSHAYDEFISMWGLNGETPEGDRVRKFFDNNVKWSDKHRADVAAYNIERTLGSTHA